MNGNDKNFLAQKIRSQYIEKSVSELDLLRALDAKVKRPANIFAYVFGSISALIMGAGMSLVMTDLASRLGLGDMMIPGILIGILGMLLAILNYPLYNALLKARKKKYSKQILELSDHIIEA